MVRSSRAHARLIALWCALAGCAGPPPPAPPRELGLAVGVTHACATVDGALTCWGANDWGQRGEALAPLEPLRDVDAGGSTTCVIDEAGAVFCFGLNHHGQLGDRTLEASARPRRVEGIPPMQEVSVGFAHVCARALDGAVCCWGWNSAGHSDPGSAPDDVLEPVCRDLGAQRVVAGYIDTCVIDAGGAMSCFGLHGSSADGVADVAIGVDHLCALRADGLTCFGHEPGGLGDPLDAPLVLPFDGGRLAAGAIDHLCATDAAGSARCMGTNMEGQLGDGTFVLREAPVVVRELPAPVTAIGVGDRHSCAIAADEIWCWGGNDLDQLGDGSGIPSLDPIAVAIP